MLTVAKGLFGIDLYSVVDVHIAIMTISDFAFYLKTNPDDLRNKLLSEFNGVLHENVPSVFFKTSEDARKALEYLEPLCIMAKLTKEDK